MFDKFISFAENEFERTLFMTFFYTGARVSEIRALEWNDIDFDSGLVKIRRQVTSKVSGEPNKIITPKSESSNRGIFVPTLLIDQLKIWKNDRMRYKSFNSNWRVFGDYSFVSEQRIRRIANRLSNASNLPHIKLHDFRHSYSTMLHNKGVDLKIIQSQAGHSTVQITLDTYTHISMQQKKQTIVNIFDNDKKEKKLFLRIKILSIKIIC